MNISEFTRTEARIHEFLSRIESGMTETEAGDTRESARAASEAQDMLDVYNIGRYLGTAREEADIKANPVPLVATRHVFFAEPSPGGTANSEGARTTREAESRIWQGLMHALSEHNLCRAFDDARFNDHYQRHSAGFTVVGDPLNTRVTIALFKWRKARIEGRIERRWPRFQARQAAAGRHDGGREAFRESFVNEAVTEIERSMKQRRLDRGVEAEMAAVARYHRAAIARFVSEYLDLRR